jgi:integrase
MQKRLRAAEVANLLATDHHKDTSYFDTELARFALRVKPTGKASYFVRYTSKETGRETRIVVGDAQALTLEEARKAARRLLAEVDAGGDPKVDRDQDRREWTFADLWSSYSNSDAYRCHAAKSQTCDRSRWNVHLSHRLGKLKLSTFDVPAAKRLYDAVSKPKLGHDTGSRGVRSVGGSGTARKALRLVSAMLSYAVEVGQLRQNPLIGQFRIQGDNRRETILAKDGYALLFATMDDWVCEGRLRAVSRDALFFIAATGCRRGEAINLCWRHVDFPSRIATLQPNEHKTGKRTQKPRKIGLVPAVVELLKQRARDAGLDEDDAGTSDALVFPPTEGQVLNLNRDWVRIRTHLGLPSDLVIHSLRHSMASHAAMAGLSPHELMSALGHRQVSTVTRYISFAEEQARVHDRAAQAALGDLSLRRRAEGSVSGADGSPTPQVGDAHLA